MERHSKGVKQRRMSWKKRSIEGSAPLSSTRITSTPTKQPSLAPSAAKTTHAPACDTFPFQKPPPELVWAVGCCR